MIYFPFDNASSTNLDRNVSSDVYADYMAMFFRNGVHITEDSSYFQVYSEEVVDQMTVQVKVGLGLINGRFAHEDTERTLIIQASEAQDRIDAVVLRLDLSLREIDLYVVKGTAGSSPVAPTPTRAGDVYELVLAHVYINATSTTITNDKITDTRLNSDLCGVIAGTVEEVDTTAIFNQYQAALDAFLAIVQSSIDETMYGQLVAMIDLKADLDSPNFTGSPTIEGVGISTKSFLLSKILATASWVADGSYWKYAIPITEAEAGLITTNTKIELIPLERSTFGTAALFKTYLDLIQNANIQGESITATSSGTGYANVIAMDTKPASDVTIKVNVRGD